MAASNLSQWKEVLEKTSQQLVQAQSETNLKKEKLEQLFQDRINRLVDDTTIGSKKEKEVKNVQVTNDIVILFNSNGEAIAEMLQKDLLVVDPSLNIIFGADEVATGKLLVPIITKGAMEDPQFIRGLETAVLLTKDTKIVHDFFSCSFPTEIPDSIQSLFLEEHITYLKEYNDIVARNLKATLKEIQNREDASSAASSYDIFVSQKRSTGQVIAGRLYAKMKETGFSVFLSNEAASNSDKIIEVSDTVIIILSQGYLDTPECIKEIRAAIKHKKPIIAIRHILNRLPQQWPASLADIQYVLSTCPVLEWVAEYNTDCVRKVKEYTGAASKAALEALPRWLLDHQYYKSVANKEPVSVKVDSWKFDWCQLLAGLQDYLGTSVSFLETGSFTEASSIVLPLKTDFKGPINSEALNDSSVAYLAEFFPNLEDLRTVSRRLTDTAIDHIAHKLYNIKHIDAENLTIGADAMKLLLEKCKLETLRCALEDNSFSKAPKHSSIIKLRVYSASNADLLNIAAKLTSLSDFEIYEIPESVEGLAAYFKASKTLKRFCCGYYFDLDGTVALSSQTLESLNGVNVLATQVMENLASNFPHLKHLEIGTLSEEVSEESVQKFCKECTHLEFLKAKLPEGKVESNMNAILQPVKKISKVSSTILFSFGFSMSSGVETTFKFSSKDTISEVITECPESGYSVLGCFDKVEQFRLHTPMGLPGELLLDVLTKFPVTKQIQHLFINGGQFGDLESQIWEALDSIAPLLTEFQFTLAPENNVDRLKSLLRQLPKTMKFLSLRDVPSDESLLRIVTHDHFEFIENISIVALTYWPRLFELFHGGSVRSTSLELFPVEEATKEDLEVLTTEPCITFQLKELDLADNLKHVFRYQQPFAKLIDEILNTRITNIKLDRVTSMLQKSVTYKRPPPAETVKGFDPNFTLIKNLDSNVIHDLALCYVGNGYPAATSLTRLLTGKATFKEIAVSKRVTTPPTIETVVAGCRMLIVILSQDALLDRKFVYAMEAANHYKKGVLLVHDAETCFFPPYSQQPASVKHFFSEKAITLLDDYADVAVDGILSSLSKLKQASKAKEYHTGPHDIKAQLFLSHKRTTAQHIAGRLYDDLRKHYSIFLDSEAEFNIHDLEELVLHTDNFILILSDWYFESEFCLAELKSAILNKRRVIVIRNFDFKYPENLDPVVVQMLETAPQLTWMADYHLDVVEKLKEMIGGGLKTLKYIKLNEEKHPWFAEGLRNARFDAANPLQLQALTINLGELDDFLRGLRINYKCNITHVVLKNFSHIQPVHLDLISKSCPSIVSIDLSNVLSVNGPAIQVILERLPIHTLTATCKTEVFLSIAKYSKNLVNLNAIYSGDWEGIYAVLNSCKSLNNLQMSFYSRDYTIPTGNLGTYPNVEHLQITKSNEVPVEFYLLLFPSLPNLKSLNLFFTKANDQAAKAISIYLPKLENLNLAGTEVTAQGILKIARSSIPLKFFTFSFENKEDSKEFLSNCKNGTLTTFVSRGRQASIRSVVESGITTIKNLSIEYYTDTDLKSLPPLPSVEILSIGDIGSNPPTISELAHLFPNLRELYLSWSYGEIPSEEAEKQIIADMFDSQLPKLEATLLSSKIWVEYALEHAPENITLYYNSEKYLASYVAAAKRTVKPLRLSELPVFNF